ncbi:MAG: hypothetical protein KatS3mg105_1416 [Gemmatales bacterium]|nr:MAG: hypothetical protein KatS3mg105_1416 [Gemmatales bacterium]
MKKEMLINVLQPEECRIAIVEDGVLEELYVERTAHESYVGNIYKGRIVNIEPSIQAAFVDFGVGRNGFLHVSDVEPAYYRHLLEPQQQQPSRQGGNRKRKRTNQAANQGETSPTATLQPAEAEVEPVVGAELEVTDFEEHEFHDEIENNDEPTDATTHSAAWEEQHDADLVTDSETDEEKASVEHETPSQAESEEGNGFQSGSETQEYMDSAERHSEGDGQAEVVDEEIFFPRAADEEHDEQAAAADEADEEGVADANEEPALDDVEPAETDWEEEPAAEVPSLPDRRRRQRASGRNRNRRGLSRNSQARPKPLIQDIFKRGQEVLVQVIKEGLGTKGPTLSTYISIAGRYLVLMPGLNRIGVSRKITDEEQRQRLRAILNELHPPKGLGFIIRTAGLDRTKKELQRDLAYLSRLWQVVVRRIRKLKAPAEIYQESDMITRTIRDTFSSDIDTIWVDEPTAFEHAQEFLQIVMPRYASRIKLYSDPEPIFHRWGIEKDISRIQDRHVPLPLGGSIVIDQTEALVAIDVNSGNFRADNNAEETAYQMNLAAAKEIARQLRLRDLGGVIVNDFIDMREEKHRRSVERALREAVKRDRARTKILRMSAFGIIEMTRQRIRPSLKRSVYHDCPYCAGTGQVKTCESMSIDVMRMLQLAAYQNNVHTITIRVAEDVASYLLNRKRKQISDLEQARNIQVQILPVLGAPPETMEFRCTDANNNELKILDDDDIKPRRR